MNANITLLSTANTFEDQMITVNNLANAINQLRNGLFYSDNGSVTLANGVLLITTSTGTVVSVSGNATFSQQITTGSIQNQGVFTSQGNTAVFSNPNVVVQVANTLVAKYLIANTNTTTVNLAVTANANVNGIMNVNTQILAPLANITNANIVLLDVQTIHVGNVLVANDIIFDNTATYSQLQGNAVFNNLTVKGQQTVLGSTVLGSNAFQIRANVPTDGFGAFQSYRGNVVNANATIMFNSTGKVWQTTANDAQSFSTILTTANLVTTFAAVFNSTDTANTPSVSAVNATYFAALSNATAIVANNGTFVAQRKGFNLVSGTNINLNVAANTTNTNLTDIIISSTTQLTDTYLSANTTTAATANAVNAAYAAADSDARAAYAQANAAYAQANTATSTGSAALPLAGGTMAGAIKMANNQVYTPTLKAEHYSYANGGSFGTSSFVLDLGVNGNYVDLTLTGNPTLTLSNAGPTGTVTTVTMFLRQDGTGSRTVNFSNTIRWSDNTTPVLSTLPNVLDILQVMTYNGSIWWGAQVMANIPGANQY